MGGRGDVRYIDILWSTHFNICILCIQIFFNSIGCRLAPPSDFFSAKYSIEHPIHFIKHFLISQCALMVYLHYTIKLYLVSFGVEFKGIKTVFCTFTVCLVTPIFDFFFTSKVATLQSFYWYLYILLAIIWIRGYDDRLLQISFIHNRHETNLNVWIKSLMLTS